MNKVLSTFSPLTTACVIESAHLSPFLRRPLKLWWYVVVISKDCDIRARQLFRSERECVRLRQGAFHTCDRYGTALTAVETHPYRATVFKKNLQRNPNHNYSACHVKSFSCWNLFFPPCITNLEKKQACKQQQIFFHPLSGRQEKEKKHWLTSAAAAWWALSTCSMSLLRCVRDSHVKMQPSATRNNSQDVSVFIYPLHS